MWVTCIFLGRPTAFIWFSKGFVHQKGLRTTIWQRCTHVWGWKKLATHAPHNSISLGTVRRVSINKRKAGCNFRWESEQMRTSLEKAVLLPSYWTGSRTLHSMNYWVHFWEEALKDWWSSSLLSVQVSHGSLTISIAPLARRVSLFCPWWTRSWGCSTSRQSDKFPPTCPLSYLHPGTIVEALTYHPPHFRSHLRGNGSI